MSFAENAAEIVNNLSGQSSWNVRDMTASAKQHKQSRDAVAVKVAASLLFRVLDGFIVLCRTMHTRAKICIIKVRILKKIPPVRALPQGGNVFVLLGYVAAICKSLVHDLSFVIHHASIMFTNAVYTYLFNLNVFQDIPKHFIIRSYCA